MKTLKTAMAIAAGLTLLAALAGCTSNGRTAIETGGDKLADSNAESSAEQTRNNGSNSDENAGNGLSDDDPALSAQSKPNNKQDAGAAQAQSQPPAPDQKKDGGATQPDADSTPPAQPNNEQTQPDAGQAQPDSGPTASPDNIFRTPELGALVKVNSNTQIRQARKPAWSQEAVATAAFERENGKIYTVLVYPLPEGEMFEDWMSRSEVGDAFISSQTLLTKNGYVGYAYKTNDYGVAPAVHIIVPAERFVYYFRTEETEFEIPGDFLNFVKEVEVLQ